MRSVFYCEGPPRGRQKDEARIVSATMDETGLFGVRDCLLKVRPRKTDIAADAFSSPPGMRAVGTQAVELGDERRRALQTVLDHAGDIGVAQRVPPAGRRSAYR